MKPEQRFVMLDPATDEVLSLCAGADEGGKCPVADTPPYLCQGLHLVGVDGTQERRINLTVEQMFPGRCPLAAVDDPVVAPTAG